MGFRAGVITVILALSLVSAVPAALADGDPASDVLSTYSLFVPADAHLPPALEARLEATLKASATAGFPIHVALINSASDLGTVTALWKKPGTYAKYLDTELASLYRGQVLVVMPDAFGLAGPSSGAHAVTNTSPETGIQALSPAAGPRLALAAISAVPLLAKADGHPFSSADVRFSAVTYAAPGTPWTVWLVLVAGVIIVALVWRASLRARPLRSGGAAGA